MFSKHPLNIRDLPQESQTAIHAHWTILPSSPKQNGKGLFSCLICFASSRAYAVTDYTSTGDDLTVVFVTLRHFRCYRKLRMFVIKEYAALCQPGQW